MADLEYRLEAGAAASATSTAERAIWEAEREDLCRQLVEMQTRLAEPKKREALEAELAAARTLTGSGRKPPRWAVTILPRSRKSKAGRDSALAEAAALRARGGAPAAVRRGAPSPEAFESLKRDRDSTLVQVGMRRSEVIELRAARADACR